MSNRNPKLNGCESQGYASRNNNCEYCVLVSSLLFQLMEGALAVLALSIQMFRESCILESMRCISF